MGIISSPLLPPYVVQCRPPLSEMPSLGFCNRASPAKSHTVLNLAEASALMMVFAERRWASGAVNGLGVMPWLSRSRS
jgi:hypothetical protein